MNRISVAMFLQIALLSSFKLAKLHYVVIVNPLYSV